MLAEYSIIYRFIFLFNINFLFSVRTTLSGIAKGALIMLALGFLTNTFRFIPKTTLAAVIICAMFAMVDVQEIKDIWRSKRMLVDFSSQK